MIAISRNAKTNERYIAQIKTVSGTFYIANRSGTDLTRDVSRAFPFRSRTQAKKRVSLSNGEITIYRVEIKNSGFFSRLRR